MLLAITQSGNNKVKQLGILNVWINITNVLQQRKCFANIMKCTPILPVQSISQFAHFILLHSLP